MKIVGISGKSGSGKTSLIKSLRSQFDEKDVCILSLDNYYKTRTDQVKDEKGYYNFDLMSSFDWDRVVENVNELCRGHEVKQLQYVFNNEEKPSWIIYQPAKVLVIEGIFVLAETRIWDMLDYSIIIDADTDICRSRRLLRDVRERNYDEEEILHRFNNHVLPAFDDLIEPLKAKVDMVLINDKELSVAKRKLIDTVNAFLS